MAEFSGKPLHESDYTIMMTLTYQLGPAAVSVDNVTLDELGIVLDVLADRRADVLQNSHTEAIATAYIDVVPRLARESGPVTNGAAEPGTVTNGAADRFATEKQYLEPPELDGDDALARVAFDAFTAVHPEVAFPPWEDTYTKPGWRAASAAVRTAAQLQQASRVAEQV